MTAAVAPRLQLAGDRQTGQDVRTQNVMAVTAVANIVKSSLGPVGLDKVNARQLWHVQRVKGPPEDVDLFLRSIV
jgi:hypothetical protein